MYICHEMVQEQMTLQFQKSLPTNCHPNHPCRRCRSPLRSQFAMQVMRVTG